MTTTPDPTPELISDLIAETIRRVDGQHKMGAGTLSEHIEAALRARGLLVDAPREAPTEEQIERGYRAFCEARLGRTISDLEYEALRSRLEASWIGATLAAAGVAPQEPSAVVDDAADEQDNPDLHMTAQVRP